MSEKKKMEINTRTNKNEKKNDLVNSQVNLISDDEGLEKNYGFGISAHKLEKIVGNYKERGSDFKDLKFLENKMVY